MDIARIKVNSSDVFRQKHQEYTADPCYVASGGLLQVDLGEGKICFCCEEFQPAKCTDKENALKLFPVQPCSAVHLLLKVP
ncbi:hypothetical protein P7K49_000937 [Saguinus oedipus]|uniref:Uncharacterized protein n=1 Tax=Saguinus oedipus TaxID=9490 RepID=A0ABQ9WD65_SAGOE|nr:hypothetical protein P7K49_000937 [Saguinus oedipus]